MKSLPKHTDLEKLKVNVVMHQNKRKLQVKSGRVELAKSIIPDNVTNETAVIIMQQYIARNNSLPSTAGELFFGVIPIRDSNIVPTPADADADAVDELSIKAAFEAMLNSAKFSQKTGHELTPKTESSYRGYINQFIKFLQTLPEPPAYWSELQATHFEDYMRYLATTVKSRKSDKVGAAKDTRRLYLTVLKRTCEYMFKKHDIPSAFAKAEIRIPAGGASKSISQTPSLQKAMEYALWFNQHANGYRTTATIILVMMLSGGRKYEVCALRKKDVTVTKSGVMYIHFTATDKKPFVKNDYSDRNIPVVPMLAKIIKAHLKNARSEEDVIFKSQKGNALVRANGNCNIDKITQRAFCAGVEADNFAKGASASLMRKTFLTECVIGRLEECVRELYVGHAPKDITGKHYVAMQEEHVLEFVNDLEKLLKKRVKKETINEILKFYT